jgi:hypothetical protein
MTIEEAKLSLLESEQPEAGSTREWIGMNPGRAILLAAGVGLVLGMFPSVRRIAVPLAMQAAKRSFF